MTLGDAVSLYLYMKKGVPQGSAISPLSFFIPFSWIIFNNLILFGRPKMICIVTSYYTYSYYTVYSVALYRTKVTFFICHTIPKFCFINLMILSYFFIASGSIYQWS